MARIVVPEAFEYVNEILWCYHLNKTSLVDLWHRTIILSHWNFLNLFLFYYICVIVMATIMSERCNLFKQ